MIKQISFQVLAFIAIWSASCFAKPGDYIPVTSGVSVGVRGSWMKWKAENNFSGYFVGPSATVDFRKPNFIYGGGRFFLTYGDLGSSNCFGRRSQFLNLEGRFGYSFGKNFIFTPYTGLGYINTEMTLKGQGGLCHKKAFTNIYVPVGAVITYHFSDRLSFGVDYEYMPAIDSYAREADFKSVRWNLGDKGSHNVELPLQFMFPNPRFKKVQYRITPFFRTYTYGRGEISCTTSDSATISSQWAYEVGLKYDVVFF